MTPVIEGSEEASIEVCRSVDGSTRVVVVGPIDHANVDEFRSITSGLEGRRAIVLDLGACTDVDAAGLGALIRCIRRVHESGGRVVVTTCKGSPVSVRLRHSGVSRLAPVIARTDRGSAAA